MQFTEVKFSPSTVGWNTEKASNADGFWVFIEDFDYGWDVEIAHFAMAPNAVGYLLGIAAG
jgi:hypothetical protein